MSRARPLVVGAVALVVLTLALQALGLSISTATQVVCLSIAALGLNILVGYTGLTSFGHSAWFGIGADAAAIAQREWFPGQIPSPSPLSGWGRTCVTNTSAPFF
jgi:ABC-type branched-subunit amino acid transport system permease subunit